jgi:hypothetical protein
MPTCFFGKSTQARLFPKQDVMQPYPFPEGHLQRGGFLQAQWRRTFRSGGGSTLIIYPVVPFISQGFSSSESKLPPPALVMGRSSSSSLLTSYSITSVVLLVVAHSSTRVYHNALPVCPPHNGVYTAEPFDSRNRNRRGHRGCIGAGNCKWSASTMPTSAQAFASCLFSKFTLMFAAKIRFSSATC